MKKYLIYNLIGAVLLVLGMASCDQASQEPADIISPDDKPAVTFTTDFQGGNLTEGNTIEYTISIDKMLDRSITFSVNLLEGDAEADHDFIVTPATIPAYGKEAVLTIEFPNDNYPETAEQIMNLKFEVVIPSIADKYLVHPDTQFPEFDVNLQNKNSETGLTLYLEWDTDDDFDLFPYDLVNDYYPTWDGATGANPEICILENAEPDADYYLIGDPYSVDNDLVNFELRLGYPDQTVDVITGEFDMSTYGGVLGIIEKVGSDYTFTYAL